MGGEGNRVVGGVPPMQRNLVWLERGVVRQKRYSGAWGVWRGSAPRAFSRVSLSCLLPRLTWT